MSNARYNVERALAALAAAVGQALPLDENGQCGMSFESQVEITIAYADEAEVLSLRAPLTPPGQPLAPDTLHAALAQNYGRLPAGHSVALDPDGGQLMLLVLMDPELVNHEEFLEHVAGMVELVPEIRTRLV